MHLCNVSGSEFFFVCCFCVTKGLFCRAGEGGQRAVGRGQRAGEWTRGGGGNIPV